MKLCERTGVHPNALIKAGLLNWGPNYAHMNIKALEGGSMSIKSLGERFKRGRWI